MKILIINSVIDFGSTGRICLEAAKKFSSEGHSVKIAYGRMQSVTRDSKQFGIRIGTFFDVLVHGFFSRFFDKHGLLSKRATLRFLKWADDFDPDLIWIHNLHGYYINYRVLFMWLKQSNKRVVWTIHDCWSFTGHCTHFDFVQCKQWKTLCLNCPQKNNYPKTIFSNCKNNYLLKKETFCSLPKLVLVTPSKWMESMLCCSFFSQKCIKVISNGINLNSFYKEDKQYFKTSNKKIILCVSNIWNERKGIDDIIKLNQVLSDSEQIVVVGKLKYKNLPKNIIHIDQTNSVDELRALYSSADVFFNPTYEDTFSNVNMEAICCSLPVVCYRTGGACEMVDVNFLVNQGDYVSAKHIMDKLFEGKLQYNFNDRESFSKDITYQKYLDLFKEIWNN